MQPPTELTQLPNWVLWRLDDGRKVPYQINGVPAKSNDPDTWSTFESARWSGDGYAGLGFVFAKNGGLFGIDLDGCIGEDGAIQQWALDILAEFPTYAEISPSGTGVKLWGLGTLASKTGKKRTINAPAVCDKQPAIEVYDHGRYFCFTGRRLSRDPEHPNAVTDCQAALDALCERLWPAVKWTPPPVQGAAASDVEGRAEAYLRAVPPAVSGCSGHNHTFRVACVLVNGFNLSPEKAYPLLAEWNQTCDPPWNEKELRHKLDDAAKQEGPRGWLLDGRGYQGPDVDLRNLLASLDADEDPPEPEIGPVFPQDCLDRMPPTMRLAFDYVLDTAIKPQPILTLGALIAMFGAVFGRKVRDDYNTRSNILILGLSPSGSGKEHPRQAVKQILFHAGLDLLNGPERIGSHAGIISSLVQQPARLFQLDEIGRLLATMRDPKASHLYNIGTVLMQLYSSSSTVWTGDAYADLNKVKRLNQPCVCVYGTSVPDSFYAGLSAENLSDGLLGRLIVLEAAGYGKRRKPSLRDVPPLLIERLQEWATYEGGNLACDNPTPALIEKTDDAHERHEQYCEEVHQRHERDTMEAASLWSRAPEKAAKLALIYACCCPGERRITLPAIDWGRRLANYTTRLMVHRVGSKMVLSRWAADKAKAWRKVEDGMTAREFTRKAPWLKRRERDEMLSDWTDAGWLTWRDNGRRHEMVRTAAGRQVGC